MAEGGNSSTIEEEEETEEGTGNEGEGSTEGGEEGGHQYYTLGHGEFWRPEWHDEWDTDTGWPNETPVYEPGVLTYSRWSDMVYYNPTTIADLPDGVETIARVPRTVADAVADVAGNIPPVLPDEVTKCGDGMWKVDWDAYLSRSWDKVSMSKYPYSAPSVTSVVRFVRSKEHYGTGFKGQGLQSTPRNQLDTSAVPNPAHPWVLGTIDNVRVRGEDLFQSPAGTQEIRAPAAMVGTGGGMGPGVAELYGAGIPTFSKCKCV